MGTQGWRLPMRLGRVELFGFDIKTAQGHRFQRAKGGPAFPGTGNGSAQ